MTLEEADTDGRASDDGIENQHASACQTRRGLLAGIGGAGTVGGLMLVAGCLDADAEQGGDDEFELEDEDVGDDTESVDDGSSEDSKGDDQSAEDGERDDREADGSDERDDREDGDDDEESAEGDVDGADDDEDEADGDGEESDDENGSAHDGDPTVQFDGCARAEVTGSFNDDDVVYASTGFYDDGLYGNTHLEDGVTFGRDVEAPFSGTVVLELGDSRDVAVGSDDIVVTIPEYGSDGTVITGVTTDPDDAAVAGITHENPDASTCLEEIEVENVDARVVIEILDTTAPVDTGEYLEVTAEIRNVSDVDGSQEIRLLVGHDPEVVDRTTVDLDGGVADNVRLGYETASIERNQEFPVIIESADDSDTETVLVYGSG
ncbi:hypothetical protein [Natronosalvus vescus]|uniref:hypothetical protein n=1 Tax=Natronosalvus vescus TaxID=2953881 RepID=UPI002090F693|nr:hypothetical protein [Natronosalvus vescus]